MCFSGSTYSFVDSVSGRSAIKARADRGCNSSVGSENCTDIRLRTDGLCRPWTELVIGRSHPIYQD